MSTTITNLADEVAHYVDLSKGQIKDVLNHAFIAAADALAKGDELVVTDFGRISTRVRPSRKGRNPKTGEEITTRPKLVFKFTPRGYAKDLLSQAEAALAD